MKIPLIDSKGQLVARLESEQFPLKVVVLTTGGLREYMTRLNYVRDEETKKLDKTKVKSVNMTLNLPE